MHMHFSPLLQRGNRYFKLWKQNLRHTLISFIQNALSRPHAHLQRNDQ